MRIQVLPVKRFPAVPGGLAQVFNHLHLHHLRLHLLHPHHLLLLQLYPHQVHAAKKECLTNQFTYLLVRKNLCHHVAMAASIGEKRKGMMDSSFVLAKVFQTFKTSVTSQIQPPSHWLNSPPGLSGLHAREIVMEEDQLESEHA